MKEECINKNEVKSKDYYNEEVVVNLFMDNGKYRDDVPVSVNGKLYLIKRGVDVKVPRFVAEVLKNSSEQDKATAMSIQQLEQRFENDTKSMG